MACDPHSNNYRIDNKFRIILLSMIIVFDYCSYLMYLDLVSVSPIAAKLQLDPPTLPAPLQVTLDLL